MIIGGDDTPAPPASDLWSSDVRFTLTKSVCKTSEFGDSTAGCHGERSELGDASRETSLTLLPSGRWQDNQTPTIFVLSILLWAFIISLLSLVRLLQVSLWYDASRGVL